MSKVRNFAKNNAFLCLIAAIYAVLWAVYPETARLGLGNSAYYLKEMLTIMPPIFVLTALLDTWIPRETIIKYMGKDSGLKGLVLSFVMGSVAAGPIYAAFPVCVMLKKKDASIRNITVILSAWAVVKVPMLLNEMKFLGPRFMLVRWVLTIIAIVIFSSITDKIVKSEDLVLGGEEAVPGLRVDRNACIGCGLCAKNCPAIFVMEEGKARIRADVTPGDAPEEVIDGCPVKAIQEP